MNTKKEEIILTYLRLEATRQKSSLGDIASEVDIKKASIYSHFASAEALEQTAMAYCSELISQKNFDVDFKAENALQVLERLIRRFTTVFATEPLCWYYNIIQAKRLISEKYSQLYKTMDLMLTARIQVALEFCVQKDWLSIQNSDHAAMFLASCIKEKLPEAETNWEFDEIATRFVYLFGQEKDTSVK